MAGLRPSNIDMSLVNYCITLATEYFPGLEGMIWIVEPHWLVKPMMTMALKFAPQSMSDRFKYVSKKDAISRIGADFLPESMGGRMTNKIVRHQDALEFDEFVQKYDLSPAVVKKIKAKYDV